MMDDREKKGRPGGDSPSDPFGFLEAQPEEQAAERPARSYRKGSRRDLVVESEADLVLWSGVMRKRGPTLMAPWKERYFVVTSVRALPPRI